MTCNPDSSLPVGCKDGNEGFLRYVNLAELLHFRLALLPLIEELVFAGHVAAIAFCGDAFSSN